jgi:hypothetical protein
MPSLDLDRIRDALLADLETAGASYRVVRAPIRHMEWPPEHKPLRGSGGFVQRIWSGPPSERPFKFAETEGLELRVADYKYPIGSILLREEHDPVEELAGSLGQLQDDVSEHETEPWPTCPHHYHQLRPVHRGEWVVWLCPDTEELVAPFGGLPG